MKLPIPAYKSEIVSQLPIHSEFLSILRKKECLFIFKEKVVSSKYFLLFHLK